MNVSAANETHRPAVPLSVEIIPWAFFNGLIIVFGSIGNVLVVLAYRNPRMKTVTNLFIANLAFADLNVVLINVPMNILKTQLNGWPFGLVICKIVTSLLGITLAASVGSLIAIAGDRYRAIVHPLKPRMRTRHAFYIIIAIWIAAIFVATPMLVFARVENDECLEDMPMIGSIQLIRVYTYFIFVTMYILPMGAISGLYYMIYHNLMRKAPLQKSAHRARVSVVRMLIMVVIVFALCWLPFHVVMLLTLNPLDIDQTKFDAFMFALWLTSANSSFNPIIYAVFNLNYRREFARILTCGTFNVETSTDDPRSHIYTSFRKSQPMAKLSTNNGENVQLFADNDCRRSADVQTQETNGNVGNESSSLRKRDEQYEKCIKDNDNILDSNT